MSESQYLQCVSANLHNCTNVACTHSRIYILVAVILTLLLVNGCTVFAVDSPDVSRWQIPSSLAKTAQTSQTPNTTTERILYSYTVAGKSYHVKAVAVGYRESGLASWYGEKFHGRLTANQEVYDMYKLSAAHKSLPLPSYIKVLNHNNNKSVIVRVNDRGPFIEGRIVDLSYRAAKQIGMEKSGLAPVTIEVVKIPDQLQNNTFKVTDLGYIQVGRYQDIAHAFTTMRLLKKHRLVPSLTQVSDSSQDIYRVSLGPFNTQHRLQTVGRLLDKEGFKHHKVFYR